MAKIVAQRVRTATVEVGGEIIARIGPGLAILVGIREGDTDEAVDRLADKVAVMRIFNDDQGKMNRSTAEVNGSMLVVSQFTLYADARKGRRPSFIAAAGPEEGERLYLRFAERLQGHGYRVERGRFGAMMVVSLENDGPVTIVLDSNEI
jgi:D-tyrosyl-tRNA(Tyr) deacylase